METIEERREFVKINGDEAVKVSVSVTEPAGKKITLGVLNID